MCDRMASKRKTINQEDCTPQVLVKLMRELERHSKNTCQEAEKHSTLVSTYVASIKKAMNLTAAELQSLKRMEEERLVPIQQAKKKPKKGQNVEYWYTLACRVLDNIKPLADERSRLAERVQELESEKAKARA